MGEEVALIPLAFILSWNAVTARCDGSAFVTPIHYEVRVQRFRMALAPGCPLDADGAPQPCAQRTEVIQRTLQLAMVVAEPAIGEAVAWDGPDAVNSAGGRSSECTN